MGLVMESISFKLEVFEGPLDLLLNLITKHKLNICDIEISKLLEQYLLYMDQAHEQDLERQPFCCRVPRRRNSLKRNLRAHLSSILCAR